MTERSFDEMIAYFNRRVADMDISQDFKIELIGMVAALGCKHEQTARRWIPCSERLPEDKRCVLITEGDTDEYSTMIGYREKGKWEWRDDMSTAMKPNTIAWMPFPDPWRGEEDERID